MNFHETAKALNGKRSGESYLAQCPAHDDRNPSLSISYNGEKVLFHCHAGCTQDDVISALRARGLWGNKSWLKPKVQSPVKPNINEP